MQEETRNAALASIPRPPAVAYDGDCIECGADIDPARKSLGYSTCIDCANEAERRNKQVRR